MTHSTDTASPTIEGYLTMHGVKITDPVSEFTLKFKTFKLGQVVTKTKGSNWTGKVVGFYSTNLTPEGYAVESMTETGSVQIYPASALCDYAEAVRVRLANSDKVTREDIKHLYGHLNKSDTYFQRIMSTQDEVAYCADITKFEGKLTCKINAFSKTKATLQQIVNNEHVKVALDWIENNRVWFKYEHNDFHSLMEYSGDYAEIFVINQTKPKQSVTLIFPI